jgi:hypothetical protein
MMGLESSNDDPPKERKRDTIQQRNINQEVVMNVRKLSAVCLIAVLLLATGMSSQAQAGRVELFGHVSLVEGYALPTFNGFHALVQLRDTPGKTVAVLSKEPRLQSLLETALATGNLIAFKGEKMASPPLPEGGKWAVDVYSVEVVILYNTK